MQNTTVKLKFSCPKKWSDMTPQGAGRFCGDCKKVVTDFSKKEISENLLITDEQEACGNFYAQQLEKPFNDRRDKVIAFYQKINARFANAKTIKPVIGFLLFVLLISTGCRRHLRGYAAMDGTRAFDHSNKTTTTKAK